MMFPSITMRASLAVWTVLAGVESPSEKPFSTKLTEFAAPLSRPRTWSL
jgi:hypothetical protein